MRRPLLLALASLVLSLGLVPLAPAPAAAATLRAITIRMADGVALEANIVSPDGSAKRPTIVFAASWALNDVEYLAQAHEFAAAGYVVLSYTPRGFWGSGGGIEVAGPADISDLSTVLDWLVANTVADPGRIGVAGISYGSGIGLIAAAHDPRIRAVAAMSTWVDLGRSLYGDDARRGQAVALLKYSAEITGRPSPGLRSALDSFFADRDSGAVRAWADVRSAATYLAGLNRNAPAILLANSFGDSLFPPNALLEFFSRLTGPKRIELAPGDHAVVEAPGLFGLDNHVWTSVRRWFDTYLAGRPSGIERENAVVLRVRGSDDVETAATVAAALGAPVRYSLGPAHWDANGVLGDQPASWKRSIWSDVDTVACGGIALLTNGWESLTGRPPTVWLPAVNRMNAMVWISEPLPRRGRVRGSARLHTTVTGKPLVVVYLYEIDPLGKGKLVSHAPYVAGTANVDLVFPATAYDVPAGHRFALVIDTKDPLYLDTNTLRTIDFSSTAANPSWLDIPMK